MNDLLKFEIVDLSDIADLYYAKPPSCGGCGGSYGDCNGGGCGENQVQCRPSSASLEQY